MKIKKLKLLKKIFSIMLVLFLCIENFAAVVADNDGSAFITKAEFDSLKNNFQSQIDQYNTSIDSKIDGAIASYLAGIKTATSESVNILLPDSVNYGVRSIDANNPLEYKLGFPIGTYQGIEGRSQTGVSAAYVLQVILDANTNPDENYQEKTIITNIKEDGDSSTAEWKGYFTDCYDKITFQRQSVATYGAGARMTSLDDVTFLYEMSNAYINVDTFQTAYQPLQFRIARYIGGETCNGNIMGYIAMGLIISGITHDWGVNKYPYVSVLKNYNYDMFSNFDRDKNWAYTGSYKTRFALAKDSSKQWNNPVQDSELSSANSGYTNANSNPLSPLRFIFGDNFGYNYRYFPSDGSSVTIISTSVPPVLERGWYRNTSHRSKYLPIIGFEQTYLKRWNQIYLAGTSGIAEDEINKGTTTSILRNNNNYPYLSLTAGFPLVAIKREQTFKYNLKFQDTTKNYVVWVSKKPFSETGHPDDDSNCIKLNGLDKSTNTNHGYLVKNGSGTFTTDAMESDCYLYLKWGIYNSTKANIGGGVLIPEKTGIITTQN